MTTKGLFISVCVTHEGEQVRTVPFPTVGAVAGATQLWTSCLSCELFQFSATQTGQATSPIIDLQGVTTTLTGPKGNALSLTLAVWIDSSGNQYVFQCNDQNDNLFTYSIPIFSSGQTGNVAPTRNIVGTNTGFPRQNPPAIEVFGNTTAGICTSATKIYVGFVYDATPTSKIISFDINANGNATGTVLVTDTTFLVLSLAFDSTNSRIWAAGHAYSGGQGAAQIRGYDTTGTLQTTIILPSDIGTVTSIAISPTGKLVVAGSGGSVLVYPSNPSASSIPTQHITGLLNIVGVMGAAMDRAGFLYVGGILGGDTNTYVQVFAAGATGASPTPISQFWSPLFQLMVDNTSTSIQNIQVV